MSKPIADSDVTAVLLADGWHTVAPRTFEVQPRGWLHELGATPAATAFCFTTSSGCRVAGPVTSVLATESRPRTEATKRPPRDVEHGRLAVEDLRALSALAGRTVQVFKTGELYTDLDGQVLAVGPSTVTREKIGSPAIPAAVFDRLGVNPDDYPSLTVTG